MKELSQPQAGKVVLNASFITFLGFLDNNLLIPVVALYAAELGASVGIIGVIVGLYSLTNTPANIIFGRLIDRMGFKLPLAVGLLGDTLSMILYSVCRLPFHLALVRMLHGITGAPVGPATMLVIADYGKQTQKGRAMAFYGIAIGLSTLVAFGLSGVIVSGLGFSGVFLIGAVFPLLGMVLAFWLPGRWGPAHIEARQVPGAGWDKARALLKRKGLLASYCTIFAQYFTFGGVVTLLPIYIKNLGMEAFHVGMLLAAFAVMFVILQMPVGYLSDRLGRAGLVAVGICLSVFALLLLPHITAFPLLIALMAMYGVAYGTIFPSISAMVADETSPDERGLATGIFHALLTAGVAIGAPLMGWAGGSLGVEFGLRLSASVMVIALVVTLATRRHH